MAEPRPPFARIGTLRLRLPAGSAAEGREIAIQVGRRLALGLPAGAAGQWGGLSVRLRQARPATPGETAVAVAAAIAGRLGGGEDA